MVNNKVQLRREFSEVRSNARSPQGYRRGREGYRLAG
jgi:hypothetical protein